MGELYTIKLTDAELAHLDGHCTSATQALVDASKSRQRVEATGLPSGIARFVVEAVEEARAAGRLAYCRVSIGHCDACGKSAGYATVKRSTRTKLKGNVDHDKPLTMAGVDVSDRGFHIRGRAVLGCCMACWEQARPVLAVELDGVRAEVPGDITNYQPRYRRHELAHCTQCDWRGHRGEMGMLPALISGSYAGQCPTCGAKNMPFGARLVEVGGGHVVVEAAAE